MIHGRWYLPTWTRMSMCEAGVSRDLASHWHPLPFDSEPARAYGRMYTALRARGRTDRRRAADLLIAATALANGLPRPPGIPRISPAWPPLSS